MTRATAAQADVALVDPAPDDLVIPTRRLRPGLDSDGFARFRDQRWCLSDMEHKQTGLVKFIHWQTFPQSLQASMKRVVWAVINLPTPDVLLRRPRSTARPFITAGTLYHAVKAWRDLAQWLARQQITSLDEVDQALLENYALAVRQRGRTFAHDRNTLFAVTRMSAYAPFLLPQDRICMPPWDNPATELTDFLGADDDPRSENTTAVIHPATMSPLLVWALRTVTDLAPDIVAAMHERRRLLDRIPVRGARGLKGRAVRQRMRDYFIHLRATGQSIPTYTGHLAPTLSPTSSRPDNLQQPAPARDVPGGNSRRHRQADRQPPARLPRNPGRYAIG